MAARGLTVRPAWGGHAMQVSTAERRSEAPVSAFACRARLGEHRLRWLARIGAAWAPTRACEPGDRCRSTCSKRRELADHCPPTSSGSAHGCRRHAPQISQRQADIDTRPCSRGVSDVRPCHERGVSWLGVRGAERRIGGISPRVIPAGRAVVALNTARGRLGTNLLDVADQQAPRLLLRFGYLQHSRQLGLVTLARALLAGRAGVVTSNPSADQQDRQQSRRP